MKKYYTEKRWIAERIDDVTYQLAQLPDKGRGAGALQVASPRGVPAGARGAV